MGNQQVSNFYVIPLANESLQYVVDRLGNVYSLKAKGHFKLKQHEHSGKSSKPQLRVKAGTKTHLVHRLVMAAKIGRMLLREEHVNHIDGNPSNNCWDNLEITTHTENVKHAVKNKLYLQGDAWYLARGLKPKN